MCGKLGCIVEYSVYKKLLRREPEILKAEKWKKKNSKKAQIIFVYADTYIYKDERK